MEKFKFATPPENFPPKLRCLTCTTIHSKNACGVGEAFHGAVCAEKLKQWCAFCSKCANLHKFLHESKNVITFEKHKKCAGHKFAHFQNVASYVQGFPDRKTAKPHNKCTLGLTKQVRPLRIRIVHHSDLVAGSGNDLLRERGTRVS